MYPSKKRLMQHVFTMVRSLKIKNTSNPVKGKDLKNMKIYC